MLDVKLAAEPHYLASPAERPIHPSFFRMKRLLLVCAIACAKIDISWAALDGAKIDQITGLKGKLSEKENVYKVT